MYIKKNGLILIPVTYDIIKRLIAIPTENPENPEGVLTLELPENNPLKISAGWLEDFKEIAHLFIKELEDSINIGWSVWFIIEKESNLIIGDAGFKGKPDTNGLVEVGYQINAAYRNKGYATSAVKGLIAWAFNQEIVKKVKAECRIDNFPSIRVLEKAGFSKLKMEGKMIKWEITRPSKNGLNPALVGYCGFFCGSCPTYIERLCTGCQLAHDEGDCFTNTCVQKKGLRYCGECTDFPCAVIINRQKATILDKKWLQWKNRQKENKK
jgi:ribosomal-protein-alanine N-acetyltransferase